MAEVDDSDFYAISPLEQLQDNVTKLSMKTDKYGGKKVKKSKVKKSKKQANSNFNDNQEKSSRNLIADTSVMQSFIMSP